MSTRIAFIGLGIMGAPMAANLVRAGFEVTGHNRSPGQVDKLVAAGLSGDVADLVSAMLAPSRRRRPHSAALVATILSRAAAAH